MTLAPFNDYSKGEEHLPAVPIRTPTAGIVRQGGSHGTSVELKSSERGSDLWH